MDFGILGGQLRRGLQVLQGLGGRSFREQDLAEQVPRIGEIRLRLEGGAQYRDRRLRLLERFEHDGEILLGQEVSWVSRQLGTQGLLGLGEPALLQVDDAEGGVGLRHIGLEPERPL